MESLAAFGLVLAGITLVSIRYRISPFFTLTGGALFFGLLTGLSLDETMQGILAGIGKVFSAFGIIILSGSVISRLLREQDQIPEIVSDIRQYVKNQQILAGISGYLLSVPITCCITGYLMLTPILSNLENHPYRRNILLYLAATGGIISYALVYPTPVNIPLFRAFAQEVSLVTYEIIAAVLSLILLALLYRYYRTITPDDMLARAPALPPLPSDTRIHWRAWSPFIAIIFFIPIFLLTPGLSQGSMISLIMLAGVVTALILAPPGPRQTGLTDGAKHAGVIIFDICGAGALGYVIVRSGFAEELLGQMTLSLPIILIPFILASLLETAQGSRVVTAVISAEILAGTQVTASISPITLILLISAGSCMISYVTDPFFWIIQRTTGDEVKTVVKLYTLPVALAGVIIFLCAILLEYTGVTG